MTSTSETEQHTEPAPCMHVIGIGRTGCVYVEALLRTGEIEDVLVDAGATFAALAIDIGDDDMSLAQDYGYSFTKRLESRAIPTDRYSFQSISLDVPAGDGLHDSLMSTAPAGASFEPYVAKGTTMPAAGEHVPRAIAKAIYASDSKIDAALTTFIALVEKATTPSIIAICCSLAGGTGTGIMVDLARHLSEKLSKPATIIGVGQLPHSGDPETYKDSAALYTTLNDLDCMLDEKKSAAVIEAYGKQYSNPFNGGFFVINPEQSWQRLTAYTTTGEARIRQAIKEMVTNRFVADSFMRWAVGEKGSDLEKVLHPTKSPDASGTASGPFMLFNVAKLTHPGVQVLPGEAPSKWGGVIAQWIDFTPKYDGLKDGFQTDFAHVSVYGSRNMVHEDLADGFRAMTRKSYLVDKESDLPITVHEFFDVLTAYGNVVLLGVSKTDLEAFWSSQKTFDKLSGEEKLKEHSWLIEVGPMLSDSTAKFAGLPSQCATGKPVVPAEEMRGGAAPATAPAAQPA